MNLLAMTFCDDSDCTYPQFSDNVLQRQAAKSTRSVLPGNRCRVNYAFSIP